MKRSGFFLGVILCSSVSFSQINARKVPTNLNTDYISEKLWAQADKDFDVTLMAQPMVTPRPKQTSVSKISVAALHDGKGIVFRLRWADPQVNDSLRIKTYSDAVAVQFPIKDNNQPPAIMMGHKDNPVHIFHWRYQYQKDVEQGSKREIKQIYPNMNIDMYPADYKFEGNIPQATQDQKEAFIGGIAVGNPKSYYMSGGVDELMAEGFGTTVTRPEHSSTGRGEWNNGQWQVFILRPLRYLEGSNLEVGGKSHVAFAVWQGQNEEAGGMKSLTMNWTPLTLAAQ